MAEKKDETKTVPEVTYTVDEYVENLQVLGGSQDIIRTAFARAGVKEATGSCRFWSSWRDSEDHIKDRSSFTLYGEWNDRCSGKTV